MAFPGAGEVGARINRLCAQAARPQRILHNLPDFGGKPRRQQDGIDPAMLTSAHQTSNATISIEYNRLNRVAKLTPGEQLLYLERVVVRGLILDHGRASSRARTADLVPSERERPCN